MFLYYPSYCIINYGVKKSNYASDYLKLHLCNKNCNLLHGVTNKKSTEYLICTNIQKIE